MKIKNNNLLVSVSGGRTSMLMAIWLYENFRKQYNIIFIFANTGAELEETLVFVNMCDYIFNLNIVWVEAVVHKGRKGTGYKVVNFATASRKNEPFEEVVKKYGIPNKSYRHCNRELKLAPIHKYAIDVFGGKTYKNYSTAIGIRVDEFDRMDQNASDKNFIYPLIGYNPKTKQQVLDWWKEQVYDLAIPEHHGNCQACFKKSNRKLATISVEHPERFDFMRHIENSYGDVKRKAGQPGRKIFRGNNSVDDIFAIAKDEKFIMYTDPNFIPTFDEIDVDQSCSTDCF